MEEKEKKKKRLATLGPFYAHKNKYDKVESIVAALILSMAIGKREKRKRETLIKI